MGPVVYTTVKPPPPATREKYDPGSNLLTPPYAGATAQEYMKKVTTIA